MASGCTPHEANIIAHQVFEAQKRTLDDDKRRRLSNVLINGLCTEHWDKATHRLMVRLAEELEEEHVERLRLELRTIEQRQERHGGMLRLDACRTGAQRAGCPVNRREEI